jgi:hypothetical protein
MAPEQRREEADQKDGSCDLAQQAVDGDERADLILSHWSWRDKVGSGGIIGRRRREL